LADNTQIGRATADVIRDIVVPAEENGHREVAAAGKQALPVVLELQSDRMEQAQRLLGQAPGALHGEFEAGIAIDDRPGHEIEELLREIAEFRCEATKRPRPFSPIG